MSIHEGFKSLVALAGGQSKVKAIFRLDQRSGELNTIDVDSRSFITRRHELTMHA